MNISVLLVWELNGVWF